jgi:hypothetical protein
MRAKNIIISIIGIIVVLILVFLSQSGNLSFLGSRKTYTFVKNALGQAENSVAKGSSWIKDILFPKIGGEVQKRGEALQNEVNTEKQKVSETIGNKIKNYFSGVTNALLGKEKECQTTQTPGQPN